MQTPHAPDWRDAPYRETALPPLDIHTERDSSGEIILRHGQALVPHEPRIVMNLLAQAREQPNKVAYARRAHPGQKPPGDWQTLSYSEFAAGVQGIAQWFVNQGRPPGSVLLILTGNSPGHALVRLGAIAAGVIVCPVSASYAAAGGDHSRLRYVIDLVQPTYFFADSGAAVASAVAAIDWTERRLILGDAEQAAVPAAAAAVSLDTMRTTPVDEALVTRLATANPDDPAAYMLTSGSTGKPKAVVHTQRMISANLHQAFQVLGRTAGWSDIMLDWLPWSHVSGSFNLYAAAVFGGSLYIDDGKPAPGLFDETIYNLREIALPYFCNVPLGYSVLVSALAADEALRKTFFSKLRLMLYGGAGLSQPLMDQLQGLAVGETGHRIMMTTGYGSTESTSGCMAIYFPSDRVGIGLPMPGLETKLVPIDGQRYEVRLRGPNVMATYLNNDAATQAAFDEDGFYRTGDAATFHNRDTPQEGLAYAGRLAEEFKLSSGTWVRAGSVRAALIAALAPAVSDLLLCGTNRDCIGALGVPNAAGLASIAGSDALHPDELAAHPRVREHIERAVARYNRDNPGSSNTLRRFAFMHTLPNAGRYEISDKGTINQQITARNREDEIDALYASAPAPHVFVL